MYSEKRATHGVALGVFLIGLGLLFATHYWWPGILFVLGAVGIASSLSKGYSWYAIKGPVMLIGIGLFFAIAFSHFLPILLIMLGLFAVFGALAHSNFRMTDRPFGYEKRKNDEKFKNDSWTRDQYI